jgi:hypothetical protein
MLSALAVINNTMQQNRQQRRQENRVIHRHRAHPKVYRQFDGEQGVYGQVICQKCQCHIAYLDKAEWREVEAYNRQRQTEQRIAEMTDIYYKHPSMAKYR